MEQTPWEPNFGQGMPPDSMLPPHGQHRGLDHPGRGPNAFYAPPVMPPNHGIPPQMGGMLPAHHMDGPPMGAGRGRSPAGQPMLNGYAFPNGSPAIPTDSQPPSQGFRHIEAGGKRAEGLNTNGKRAEAPPADPGGPEHQNALMELARENLLLKHQLHAATLEVTRLQSVVETYNHIKEEKQEANNMKQSQSRYWSEEEHQRFLVAIQTYGHKDVKAIASVVRTRNATQVRTHAQKYFMKLARSRTQEGGGKGSNPDQEPSETTEDEQSKSMEAAAAAAAAAGEAGTSAAAAAAFVAATNKQQSASKQRTTTPKVEQVTSTPKNGKVTP
eukprot:CAMPEP_0196718590 /NCGR_PEP_ID=MMETSP1091-20130531/1761_1 /TAXON_ID=302021 /ORGANISM="Rhodomonas sp., Strain CCMP768" /LENGTH=328 /DNA_ID=CAMNT_0042059293 /DNA_START=118 /DNA_END=1101 /DNA_ORIENTATION=-